MARTTHEPRGIYRCPCGFTAKYNSVYRHRQRSKNAVCKSGNLDRIGDENIVPITEPEPEPPMAEAQGFAPEYQGAGEEEDGDRWETPVAQPELPDEQRDISELIASDKAKRASLSGTGEYVAPVAQKNGNGTGDDTPPSYQKLPTIRLPASVIVLFDWCRANGGPDDLSEFVEQAILDHFTEHGLVLIVQQVRRSEV